MKKLALSFGLALVSGALVLTTYYLLWRWFVVPMGLPQLGPFHLFGLAVIVRYLQPRQRRAETDPWWDAGAYSILLSTITLGLGALASAAM